MNFSTPQRAKSPPQPRKNASNNSAPGQQRPISPQRSEQSNSRQAPQQTRNNGSGSSQQWSQSYPPCRYPCGLCNAYHFLHLCNTFLEMTVSQRREHVKSNNLCWNCLRTGHSAGNCRSDYRCRTCEGKHHTLVHTSTAEPSSQPQTEAVSTAATISTANIPSSLLMTSQVLLTGPTGRTLVARALLDSGATFSLISTRAMHTLGLIRSKTCIAIKGVQNSQSSPSHALTMFSLSPVQEPSKIFHISAAVVPEVTCDLPPQGATSVRELPHIRELSLADPHFHSSGRIDLVLGENILDRLLLPRLDPKAHPVPGRLSSDGPSGEGTPDGATAAQAVANIAITTVDDTTSKTFTRFWEVEEPPQTTPTLTTEELTVQDHYALTHAFLPSAGKYMVTLPRKTPAPVLGDSRSQAMQRYRSNECSMLHKGTGERFQAVVQEYLDLGDMLN